MPHIVLEYSDDLDADIKTSEMLHILHKAVVDTGLFTPGAVKARSVVYSEYVLPDGAESFVHVTTSILAGRTLEQRKKLNEDIFTVLKTRLPASVKISSDIREMDKDVYIKTA